MHFWFTATDKVEREESVTDPYCLEAMYHHCSETHTNACVCKKMCRSQLKTKMI